MPKKFQKLLKLALLMFLIRVQAFRDPLRRELPRVQIFMNDGPNHSAIDLTVIRRSSKISSWVWSIISGVVTILGRPRWGASQVEKSPRLNRATQFLTVAYDGACSPNVSVRMVWISFSALPCGGGMIMMMMMKARVSMLLKSSVSPDMLPFSLCNKRRLAMRHMNRPLFPTTLSILSYNNGK